MNLRYLYLLASLLLVPALMMGCEDTGVENRTPEIAADDDVPPPAPGLDDESRRMVEIIATDFEFQPDRIVAQPGEQLRIHFVNAGETDHSIEFHLGSGEEEKFAETVNANSYKDLTLTAPQEPGEYDFYCPVRDHQGRGMQGKLIVQAQQ